MKNTTLLLLFSILLFIGCGGDEGDTINGEASYKSLEISADIDEVEVTESVTFKVLADDVINVTPQAEIYVNNSKIEGDTFKATSEGELRVYAKVGATKSNEITIKAIPLGERYQKYVLVEDFTGTWCGWCPKVFNAVEKAKEQTNDIIFVAAHLSSSTDQDPMDNNYARQLAREMSISGIPAAFLDRGDQWDTDKSSNTTPLLDILKKNAPVGISMSSELKDDKIKVGVKVKFGKKFAKKLNLTLLILEDGIIHDQVNYTSYYNNAKIIKDFKHDGVLRQTLTPVLGEEITASPIVKGGIYSADFTSELPKEILDTTKLSVVAVVSYADTKKVINSRQAKVGETNDFEIK